MNERESAKRLADYLDQMKKTSQEDFKERDPELAQLIEVASSVQSCMRPDVHQRIRVKDKIKNIAPNISPQSVRKQARIHRVKKVISYALLSILLVIFALGLIWVFHGVVPQSMQQPPIPAVKNTEKYTSGGEKETGDHKRTSTVVVNPTKTVNMPESQSVVSDACQYTFSDTGLDPAYFFYDQPESFIGGGEVDTDQFSFHLWLVCDPDFKRNAVIGEQPSDIDGLGILTFWEYHGSMKEGILRDYAGFEPFVNENSGMGGPFDDQSSINLTTVHGFSIGSGVIPDFSQQDTVLRYILFTELPDGERSGAVMSFILAREENGYRPVNIQVTELSSDELVNIENQSHTNLPFAVKEIEMEMPALEPVLAQVQSWQDAWINSPGWYYQQDLNVDPDGNGLVPGMQSYQQEMWFHLTEEGMIDQSITMDTASDGRVVQQSVSSDYLSKNLTYATENPFQPYRYDEVQWLRDQFIQIVKAGRELVPVRTNWQEHEAWMIEIKDEFTSPQQVDNQTAIAIIQRTYIDAQTGRPLGRETNRITPEGMEELTYRSYRTEFSRIDELPQEIAALLSANSSGYHPADPYGTPAPQGLDPSGLPIKLHSVPGDNFEMPSFWYGDLYAGEFLLGRVDFGGLPGGGWSTCTGAGDKMAFQYQESGSNKMRLRWLNFEDVSVVYEPLPDYQTIGIQTWSPDGDHLAFFACEENNVSCSLYLLSTYDNTTRLLTNIGRSNWPILWKPDGSQLAFVDTMNEERYLYVIDTSNGSVVDQSIFVTDSWPVSPESPVAAWGVTFPKEYIANCYEDFE